MSIYTVTAICLLYLGVTQVSGLKCWQCDTFRDQGGCSVEKFNELGFQCAKHEDVCIKIVTRYQLPHDGPRNLTEERRRKNCGEATYRSGKQEIEYVSKICGEKKSFEHFADVDRKCVDQGMGGGGSQLLCVCSGNMCNSALSGRPASIYLLATVLAVLTR